MRPVGEVEHRENLLDFVSWATGGCNAEGTEGSTGEGAEESANSIRNSSCGDRDGPRSGQAKDVSTMKSNQSGKVEHPGETGSKEDKQVCGSREKVSDYVTCVCKTEGNQFVDCQVYVPEWIANPDADLAVVFSSRAEQDLINIDLSPCNWLRSAEELRWT